MNQRTRLAVHLFSETDDYGWRDLRDRVPVPWYVGEDQLGLEESFPGMDVDLLRLNGRIIVDGHHLFLNSLRLAHDNITTWNEKAANGADELVPAGASCPFEPVSERLLSYISAQLLHRTLDIATRSATLSLIPRDAHIVAYELLHHLEDNFISKHFGKDGVVALLNEWQIVSFDAPLPPLDQLINDLYWQRGKSHTHDQPLSSYIDLLQRERIEYPIGNRIVPEKYELKNAYIADLRKSYFAESVFGRKLVKYRRNTRPYLQEKQVDVLLTMELCDAATDPSLDWICVVTNDSDYVPALKRLLEKNKKVIWLCADRKRRRSKELLQLFQEDAFVIDDLFDGKSLFKTLFSQPAASAISGTLPDGGEYSTAPWCKSVHEHSMESEAEIWADLESEQSKYRTD